MFFSEYVLTKKGPLSKVWLAAHWDKKLTKTQIEKADVVSSSNRIINTDEPIALRTSGHLLLGVVKIYRRKVTYVVQDCNDTLTRLRLETAVNPRVDLTQRTASASFSTITLPDAVPVADFSAPDFSMGLLFDDNDMVQRMNQLIGDPNIPAPMPGVGGFTLLDQWEVTSTGSLDPADFADLPGGGTPMQLRVEGTPDDVMRQRRGTLSTTQPEREMTRRASMADEEALPDLWGAGAGRETLGGLELQLDDGGGGDEIRLEDLQAEQQQEAADAAADASRIVLTGRKRKRKSQWWDKHLEIPRTAYKHQLKHTADLVRPKTKIRKTHDGPLHPWERVEVGGKDAFESVFGAPTLRAISRTADLVALFHQRLAALNRGATLSDLPPIEDQQQQNADNDDNMMEMDLNDGGGGGGDEIRLEDDLDDLSSLDHAAMTPAERRRRTTMMGIEFPIDDDALLRPSNAVFQTDYFLPQSTQEEVYRDAMIRPLKNLGFADPAISFLSKFRADLDEEIEDEDEGNLQTEVSLGHMLRGKEKNRKAGAQAFAQVLALANKGMIRVRQDRAFEDVFLRRTEKFGEVMHRIDQGIGVGVDGDVDGTVMDLDF